MTTIQEVIRHLESIAPPAYQEDYDNAGLITGNPVEEVRGVLTCLDATEQVLREAVRRGCNLIVAHHPIVFKGLKKLTGGTYVERVVIEAIRQKIAIYAIHTNLDNMYLNGVNGEIAARLGLIHTRILLPRQEWHTARLTLPASLEPALRAQLLEHGAGELLHVLPAGGNAVVCDLRFDRASQNTLRQLLGALAPESLDACVWQTATNPHPGIGAGLIGELPEPLPGAQFLQLVKSGMHAACIRHTALLEKPVKKVALCGGSGSFLLGRAIAQGADAYVSADFKYHEFFDADGQILIADIGHYESEQFTVQLLQKIISQKFTNFAAYCTEASTNPVYYS
ncbi:MAG: Nif3-like dinuclear metal center hexameric protein [Haliscomenobacter sp.]|nr:Nif3-like dinuclear metal center hexameric protein [Haliscomenobacter sp.]